MDWLSVFYDILGWFGKAVIVIGAFHIGRRMGTLQKREWMNYIAVLGMVGVVSLVLWANYGTHTEDADPVYGGGETVTDFEPSDSERNARGLTWLVVLGIPSMYGVYRGQKLDKAWRKTS